MRRCLLLVVLAITPAAHAFVVGAGFGGDYFMAYRTNDQTLAFPFNLGLALQVDIGFPGKDLGLDTRARFGIGGMLNPLSSKQQGDLNLYAVTIPIWVDYPFLRKGDFFLYAGFAVGAGIGFFRNNINGERANLVLSKTSVSLRAELRIFYPSTFWLELRPGVFTEFTRSGLASTIIWGGEIYAGFSNEY
jgi:hypothetical protein